MINKRKELIDYFELTIIDKDIDIYKIPNNEKIAFIDKEGYKFNLSIDNLKVSKRRNGILAKFFNKNPFSHDNINNYLKLIKSETKLVSKDVKNAIEKVEWCCLIHNESFTRSWNVVKNGALGCNSCAKESFYNNMSHSIGYVKEQALTRFNINIVSEEYINNETPLEFICNRHNQNGIQENSWGAIISKKTPCKHCTKERLLKQNRKSQEDFESDVYSVHKDKYKVIGEYVGSSKHVKMYCNKCNNTFSMKASHILDGHGCRHCTKSKGEEKINSILKSRNIEFIEQFRFDDCKGIKIRLPFDFYIQEKNVCIEYQGIQHYKPVERFGGCNSFSIQKNNDKIKRDYCKKNDIKLIEIPYWEFNNIENILIKEVF